MAAYVSAPIEGYAPMAEPFYRADIVFYGLDHSWVSFEGRVFVNQAADEGTPLDLEHGYAGSFFIFGHGGCFGEDGHCDVPSGPVTPFDRRAPHQLTPTTKEVIATEAIQRAMAGEDLATLTISVVPVVRESRLAKAADAAEVLKFSELAIITYD